MNIKKINAKSIIIKTLIVLISLYVLYILFGLSLLFYMYNYGDAIDKASAQSSYTFIHYDITGNQERFINFFSKYHGEASGEEVYSQLVHWSVEHPKDFIEMAPQMKNRYPGFTSIFSFCLTQVKVRDQFFSVFEKNNDPIITEIKKKYKLFKENREVHD